MTQPEGPQGPSTPADSDAPLRPDTPPTPQQLAANAKAAAAAAARSAAEAVAAARNRAAAPPAGPAGPEPAGRSVLPPPPGSRPATEPPPPGSRRRVISRKRLVSQNVVIGVVVGVVAALAVWFFGPDDNDGSTATAAAPIQAAVAGSAGSDNSASSGSGDGTAADDSAAGPPPADDALAGTGPDLRRGAVFLQSNDAKGNVVVAFARDAQGKLKEQGRYPTGGTGSGSFEDSAQGLLLGTSEGEASPDQQLPHGDLLFASNAGSSTVTVFQVTADRLVQVDEVPSGGNKPVSLTVSHGTLYVLNSGETDNRLILGPTTALENCTTGSLPSVTGFAVDAGGHLSELPGSTRQIGGLKESGCAQVGFTPDGSQLLVSERVTHIPGQRAGDVGSITSFAVRSDGTLGPRRVLDATGSGPFAFTFTKTGELLTTEQNGGFANPGGGHAAAYQTGNNDLQPIGGSVANSQTDTCWIAVNSDEHLAYTAAPWGDGTIASYRVGDDELTLLKKSAAAADGKSGDPKADGTTTGLTDLALSSDGEYLYQLNSFEGVLYGFMANPDGSLTKVEEHKVFSLKTFGAGGEAAPFGIAVT
jgi:6-phosphogluconolactonase